MILTTEIQEQLQNRLIEIHQSGKGDKAIAKERPPNQSSSKSASVQSREASQ